MLHLSADECMCCCLCLLCVCVSGNNRQPPRRASAVSMQQRPSGSMLKQLAWMSTQWREQLLLVRGTPQWAQPSRAALCYAVLCCATATAAATAAAEWAVSSSSSALAGGLVSWGDERCSSIGRYLCGQDCCSSIRVVDDSCCQACSLWVVRIVTH